MDYKRATEIINREIEIYLEDEYLETYFLDIYLPDKVKVDLLDMDDIEFGYMIDDMFADKDLLTIKFKQRYIDELRKETITEWEEQEIIQRHQYYESLL